MNTSATSSHSQSSAAAPPPTTTHPTHEVLDVFVKDREQPPDEPTLPPQGFDDVDLADKQPGTEQRLHEMTELLASADLKPDLDGDLADDISHDDKDRYRDEDGGDLPQQPQNCWSRFTSRMARIIGTVIPAGGILASGMNVAGSTIGGGILGLPAGANQTGLVLAYIYVVIMVVLSVMSMRMLAITAEKTGIRSFEAMARYLLPQGRYAFSYFTAFIRWFNSMGACIAYVISIGNCMKPIFTDASEKYPDNSAYKYFMTSNGLKVITVIVFFCFMAPLVIPRHVDSLRHAAFIAIILMLYFCVIVVVHSCTHGLSKNKGHVELSGHFGRGDEDGKIFLFRTGNPCVEALGTFVFAFICQITSIEVFWDMAKHVRNPNGFTAAAAVAIGICSVIYTLVFTFGYFDFGAKELGSNSILLMYHPLKEPEVMLAYVGVMVKLCVAFALQSMAARNAAYYTIGFTERYAIKKVKPRAAALEVEADVNTASDLHNYPHKQQQQQQQRGSAARGQELRRPGEGQEVATGAGLSMDQSYLDNIPLVWHLLVVCLFAAINLILGLFIPNINVVFNFAGSICGGFLSLIAPALFIMYAGDFSLKKVGFFMWFMAYVLLVVGVIAVVFGTGATIYGLAGGE